jgi:hypothetical protein
MSGNTEKKEKKEVYIIVPINYAYNDESHYEEGLEPPEEGFLDETEAKNHLKKLNKAFAKQHDEYFTDDNGDPITVGYKLFKVNLNG